ncbi:hypothetical protein OnM2_082034 [Erysiphe neolycopersici]|uniref:Uncharacterized protein n=1 Tax=Erysiphe neolycopersici TaxID=212602 RepID=A0A420HG11_9PEZI|nr:hypothetical protein OnM2_082034 [Erysiphe neolycopersici]
MIGIEKRHWLNAIIRIKPPTSPHILEIGDVAETETAGAAVEGPEKEAPIRTRKEAAERMKLQLLRVNKLVAKEPVELEDKKGASRSMRINTNVIILINYNVTLSVIISEKANASATNGRDEAGIIIPTTTIFHMFFREASKEE